MYKELDQLIIQAVKGKRHIYYALETSNILNKICLDTGREKFRIIDGRLRSLKSKGIIVYRKKQLNNGSGGWHVV